MGSNPIRSDPSFMRSGPHSSSYPLALVKRSGSSAPNCYRVFFLGLVTVGAVFFVTRVRSLMKSERLGTGIS